MALALAGLALIALRVLYLRSYPFNSDEPQHLHVAWAWTQGLLPYRDVFDNHGPLFGLLHAPWLWLVGTRADALMWMRLPMLAWYLLALAATWHLARVLYGEGVARAATLLAALYPSFFLVSGQFRTDDLWMALWLAALAVALGGPVRAWRSFVAGVLAGAALAVSQKTLLLLGCATVAAAVAWIARPRLDLATLVRHAALGVAGLLAIPLAFAAWFAAHGAWHAAVYCLVLHNMLPGLGHWHHEAWRLAAFPPLALVAAAVAWRTARARDHAASRRAALWLLVALYVLSIYTWWPLITRQDLLPALPPLILILVGYAAAWLRPASPAVPAILAGVMAALELALLFACSPPWRDRLAAHDREVALVLNLTGPDDYVMDPKGDSIFRRRPYYYALETITERRLARGLLPDTIAGDLVRTRTMVVVDCRLPPRSRAFVERNYLPVSGDVRVAGLRLAPGASHRFVLAVPGVYAAVDAQGMVAAAVDGGATSRRWALAAGTHTLTTPARGALAIVWAPALDRGLRPEAAWWSKP
ncbi:MAG TPA: hypothetical protein VF216_10350 [Mizugakiibacter sp.]